MVELIIAVLVGLIALVQAGSWIIIGITRRTVAAVPIYALILAVITIVLVAVGLMSIPILVIIKVITGWTPAVYIAASLAAIFTAVLGFFWSPIGIIVGTIKDPKHPIVAGKRYLRGVAIMLFAELMGSLGVFIIPFHKNIGMLPVFVMVGAAVLIATIIWGSKLSGKFWKSVAIAALIIIIISFFLPKTFNVVGEKAGKIDENIAAALLREKASALTDYPICGGPPAYDMRQLHFNGDNTIHLDGDEMGLKLSPNCWSGWIKLPWDAKSYKINTFGPGCAEFKLPSGQRKLICNEEPNYNIDLPDGTFRLRGPVGKWEIILSNRKIERQI